MTGDDVSTRHSDDVDGVGEAPGSPAPSTDLASPSTAATTSAVTAAEPTEQELLCTICGLRACWQA